MLKHIFILAFALLPATVFSGQQTLSQLSVDRIANAIFRSENSKQHPYGVLIPCKNPRTVCENTIRHAWVDFRVHEGVSLEFVDFLGKRYCPPSVDPIGFKNWTNNVWRIYKGK